eukprot:m51a1_g3843 Adaptor protein complex 5 (AP-5), mu subunit (503) ;mRNA; f:359487-361146
MQSLRALWIVRGRGDQSLLFSRRWPTVEYRARALHGTLYAPLGPPRHCDYLTESALASAAAAAVSAASASARADAEGDCAPLRSVARLESPASSSPRFTLWPLCSVARDDVLFMAVPLVKAASLERMRASDELLCVSSTLKALDDVADLAAQLLPRLAAQSPAAAVDLGLLVGAALPFGRPSAMMSPDVIKALANRSAALHCPEPPARVPGWRTLCARPGARGQRVDVDVVESVNAAQYDSPARPDDCCVRGLVALDAELEGSPVVSVAVRAAEGAVSQVCAHYRAQAEAASEAEVRLTCVPPSERFTLGTYAVARPARLPIRGFFQMRLLDEGCRAMLLVQLKLDASVNNSFDFCDAVVQFARSRGPVASFQATPSVGSAVLSDAHTLVWNIGTRFSSSNLEVAMPATVTFDVAAAAAAQQDKQEGDDAFCSDGVTGFVRLRFRIRDWTASGASVDAKKGVSVVPVPKSKPSISVRRTCMSGDYLIWNSLGNSRYAVPCPV